MTKTKARITTREVKLDTPTDFGAIYSNVVNEIDTIVERYGGDEKLIFNDNKAYYSVLKAKKNINPGREVIIIKAL